MTRPYFSGRSSKTLVYQILMLFALFNNVNAQETTISYESVLSNEAAKSAINASPDTLVANLYAQITIGSRIYQSALMLTNYLDETITITKVRQLRGNLSQMVSSVVADAVPSGSTRSYSVSYGIAPLSSEFANYYAEFTISYSGGTIVFLYQNGRLTTRGISNQTVTIGEVNSLNLAQVFQRGTKPYVYQVTASDASTATASITTEILKIDGEKKGVANFVITATDAAGTTVSSFFVTTVLNPPQAINDTFTIEEDTVSEFNLLNNDLDDNGLTLSLSEVFGASHGSALVISGTSAQYSPDQDYDGQDSFRYVLSNGVSVDTASVTVTITPVNDGPTASIALSTISGQAPLGIAFDASGSSDPDGDSLVYAWDFGDGETSTGVAATHTYSTEGTFTVTLTVSDGTLTDSATDTITVAAPNTAPTASFTASTTSGQAPIEITFDASGSSDPNGDALTYVWDFGDGDTGTGESVDHTYTSGGTFTVTLTVNDGALTDSATETITVAAPNTAPTASFTSSISSGQAPIEITFDASDSSDLNGDTLTYTWIFGDGETGSGVTATHTYTSGGSFMVTLTVSDGTLTDSATETINVGSPNTAPIASFLVSKTSGLAPLLIGFVASDSSDPDGDPLTYAWDFGDGQTGVGVIASHSFTVAGEFTVTLIVSDGTLTDSATKTISVVAPNASPTASFTPSVTSGQAPIEIIFDASGSSDPNSDALTYSWGYGDGGIDVGMIATHTYTSSGDFLVTLVVSDGWLTDSATKTISIASGVAVESAEIPTEFSLDAAYPNPFNPVTTIGFSVPTTSHVRIVVTDLLGKIVAVLTDGSSVSPGIYTLRFEAGDLSSGIYLVRMEASDFLETRQIVLLK